MSAEKGGAVPSQTLYRMRSASDDLLYVGITSQRVNRWDQHAATKEWWHEVSSIDIEHFDSREGVQAAEVLAIKSESPRYNIIHNKRGRGRASAPTEMLRRRLDAPTRAPMATVYRRGSIKDECPVWLEYEISGSSMFGEFYPEDRAEAWAYFSKKYLDGGQASIYWSFAPLYESASRVLDYYDIYLRGQKLTEEMMQILPVAPSGNSSMGMKALPWRPAPLQRFVSTELVRAAYRAEDGTPS